MNSSHAPNIENLRKQAKTLLRAWRQGDSDAKTRVTALLPDKAPVGLQTAQFVLAREYGFRSWSTLTDFVPRLGRFDDIATFRIAREFDVAALRLWEALSEPDEIAQWLLPVSFEPKLGEPYTFRTKPPMTGKLGEYSHQLAIRYDSDDGAHWRFAIESQGREATRMRVTIEDKMTLESVVAHPGGAVRVWNPGVTAGWHEILDQLEFHLTGRNSPEIDYSCLCKFYERVLEDLSES